MKENTENAPVEVVHQPQQNRFVTADGGLLTYEIDGEGRFVVQHTGVPVELRGQGIAARLAEAALVFAEGKGYPVVPQCEYVAVYMKRRSPKA
ncbi:N-acetyltransferase [Ruficoccus amylovorans]|uniref:N-acetyltransferase n=1 Tax=Ruficoccus amylovorans TaxID=1804625 RepID=A0A842HBV3_9BACT|nr:GNAT family N-acetyltransferase [Ruficoccus amylovorans]MBC2592901.1 N-acetyltransferase [Ruficoccus amylovorans]